MINKQKTDNREQYDKVHCIISNLNFQAEFKYLQDLIVRFLSEECNKLDIYKKIKFEFCIEKYLDFHINVQLLTKIVVEHLN
jgi:hypothetical protein